VPEVLSRPGTDARVSAPFEGRCIDNESIETGNGFMPGFRDNQRIREAKHMLQLRLGQTQVHPTQKGQEFGRMLYNELEQGDIPFLRTLGVGYTSVRGYPLVFNLGYAQNSPNSKILKTLWKFARLQYIIIPVLSFAAGCSQNGFFSLRRHATTHSERSRLTSARTCCSLEGDNAVRGLAPVSNWMMPHAVSQIKTFEDGTMRREERFFLSLGATKHYLLAY